MGRITGNLSFCSTCYSQSDQSSGHCPSLSLILYGGSYVTCTANVVFYMIWFRTGVVFLIWQLQRERMPLLSLFYGCYNDVSSGRSRHPMARLFILRIRAAQRWFISVVIRLYRIHQFFWRIGDGVLLFSIVGYALRLTNIAINAINELKVKNLSKTPRLLLHYWNILRCLCLISLQWLVFRAGPTLPAQRRCMRQIGLQFARRRAFFVALHPALLPPLFPSGLRLIPIQRTSPSVRSRGHSRSNRIR